MRVCSRVQTVPVLCQFHVNMAPGQAVKLEAARYRLSHLSVTLCSYREVNKSTSKRANKCVKTSDIFNRSH